jgi:hypothetical protein
MQAPRDEAAIWLPGVGYPPIACPSAAALHTPTHSCAPDQPCACWVACPCCAPAPSCPCRAHLNAWYSSLMACPCSDRICTRLTLLPSSRLTRLVLRGLQNRRLPGGGCRQGRPGQGRAGQRKRQSVCVAGQLRARRPRAGLPPGGPALQLLGCSCACGAQVCRARSSCQCRAASTLTGRLRARCPAGCW